MKLVEFLENTPKTKRLSEPKYRTRICHKCTRRKALRLSEKDCFCGVFFSNTMKPNRRDGGIYSVMRRIYISRHGHKVGSIIELLPECMKPLLKSEFSNHAEFKNWQLRTSGVKNFDPDRKKYMPKLPTDSSYIQQVRSSIIIRLYKNWHFIDPDAPLDERPTQFELLKLINSAIGYAHWIMEDCDDRGDHASITYKGAVMAYKMLKEAKKDIFVRDEDNTIKRGILFNKEQEAGFWIRLNNTFKLS